MTIFPIPNLEDSVYLFLLILFKISTVGEPEGEIKMIQEYRDQKVNKCHVGKVALFDDVDSMSRNDYQLSLSAFACDPGICHVPCDPV